MFSATKQLRVALLAGTLGQGGAEKQLVYIARALKSVQVDVRVYTFTRGEYYEAVLREQGIEPVWVGQSTNPLFRVAELIRALHTFRPHVLQSGHFYTNMHTGIAGCLSSSATIGAIRGNAYYEMTANKPWGPLLLRLPPSLLANSYSAKRNAVSLGASPRSIVVLPNVLDLREFDLQVTSAGEQRAFVERKGPVVISVGNLFAYKRQDRFLKAVALARRRVAGLRGILVGEGPERANLESLARKLDLLPDGVQFTGTRSDVPVLLSQADIFLLTSGHEGLPNVVLEAMSACLPVISTPVGDVGMLVRDGIEGYIVPFDDAEQMAALIIRLAESEELRRQLGTAGRERVQMYYSLEGLGSRLLSVYRQVAHKQDNRCLLRILSESSTLLRVPSAAR